MIAFVKGIIQYSGGDHIIIENNGLGYKIFVPASTLFKMPSVGEALMVHTYLYVREDIMQFYGFLEKEELELFETLIQVSGIGPKVAIAILSAVPAPAFVQAIVKEQLNVLTQIPGIGKKTAQRMILELKDKLSKLSIEVTPISMTAASTSEADEAIQALVALGYSAVETKRAVNKVVAANPKAGVEDIIKKSLLDLARF